LARRSFFVSNGAHAGFELQAAAEREARMSGQGGLREIGHVSVPFAMARGGSSLFFRIMGQADDRGIIFGTGAKFMVQSVTDPTKVGSNEGGT